MNKQLSKKERKKKAATSLFSVLKSSAFFVLKPFMYYFGSFNYHFWIPHPKIHPDTKF